MMMMMMMMVNCFMGVLLMTAVPRQQQQEQGAKQSTQPTLQQKAILTTQNQPGNAATYSAPAVAECAAPSNEGHQLYTALLQQGGVGYAKSSGTNNISSA